MFGMTSPEGSIIEINHRTITDRRPGGGWSGIHLARRYAQMNQLARDRIGTTPGQLAIGLLIAARLRFQALAGRPAEDAYHSRIPPVKRNNLFEFFPLIRGQIGRTLGESDVRHLKRSSAVRPVEGFQRLRTPTAERYRPAIFGRRNKSDAAADCRAAGDQRRCRGGRSGNARHLSPIEFIQLLPVHVLDL